MEWVAKSIRMELFRLGRLQFEPLILDQKLAQKYHLPSGEKVLNVHIPSGMKNWITVNVKNLLNQLRNFLVTKM